MTMTSQHEAQLATCEAILANKSKSFRLASLLLPGPARAATVALYAWCRRCDDALDDLGDTRNSRAEAEQAVARLRAELEAVYAGEPQSDAVLAAFQAVVQQHHIPRLYAEELLLGMAMDAVGSHYETLPQLLLYCHRVAGTVGLMMCHVMGVSDPNALRHAAHLGIAMQLTNICRDVAEDLELGRVYLPSLLLMASGMTHSDPRKSLRSPEARAQVKRVVRRLLDEADLYYRSGDRGLRALSFRNALSVRTARLLYASIGTRLRLRGCDPMRGRVFTPKSWKLALLARVALESAVEWPRRLISRFRPVPLLRPVRYPDDVLPV